MKRFKKASLAGLTVPVLVLAGCYVVPVVDPQGNMQYYHYPLPPAGAPVSAAPRGPPIRGAPGAAAPVSVPARLYPANDLANQTGMITGTVTNMRTGKGRFQLNYQGDIADRRGDAARRTTTRRRRERLRQQRHVHAAASTR